MVNGTNPILRMDYPDPDVIRVGDTYYMVTTTMHFMPGCEILRSYDLINWEHLTYVYDRLDGTDAQRLTKDKHVFGKGMWAATIRYHEGIFYIIFVANDTGKTYLYKSRDIEGPWDKSIIEGFYHDCSLLFDEGRAYLVYGNTDVFLTELNSHMTGPKEGGLHRLIVSDEGNPNLGLEGSHIYKINGRYYLFMIHSRRDRWMRTEACFSADSLEGEFIGGDVLEDDMGLTAMGVAQGGIVDDPEGNWYSVMFHDSGALGRIPVLCPVTWENGLPVFGTGGKVPTELSLPSMKPGYEYTPLFGSDDFKDNFFEDYKEGADINRRLYGCFGLKSFWQFSHEPDLSLVSVDKKAGALRISTDKTAVNIHQARNVLTQRMISPGCAGEITVDASDLKEGDYAGITVYQGNYIWIGVTRRNGKLCAVTTTFTSEEDTWITAKEPGREQCCMPIEDTTVRLRLEASFGPGRDEAFCSILDDSEWKEFGPKHKLSFRLDHFTGARFGLFIYSTKEMGGSAAFSDFTYEAF